MNPALRSALRRLGWGLVFPLVDVHIVLVDALPDLIGYLLIVSALRRLGAGHEGVKAAIWLAVALALLSVAQLVFNASININQFATAPLAIHVYVQAAIILHGLLAYRIFQILYRIAGPIAPPPLKDAIVSRRNYYMAVFAAQLFFYPFLLNIDESWIMLLLALQLCFMLAEFLLIRLPFRMSRIRHKPPADRGENLASEPQ
ncbi:hypothetical protein [Paenibacillus methanolicus]|uniref:Uncharacterized protein n=1 Tax=Paenibacillus methanolicus TaxID=582686 RepID=A0A5S5C552_9BACL|nr:hypothetical protein [Paenibacillus methanolicus]TYP74561.1 hypothetical protein BCM02_105105 [Paenibacillus methanolicus]